jgi:magnesium chelatase subunit I
VQGLADLVGYTGVKPTDPAPTRAAAIDFILEGLYAQKKISRSDEFNYQSAEPPRRPAPRGVQTEPMMERDIPNVAGKKKYYN